ncbi:MAG: hypothetical protein CFK49_10785 [Armatimonadetes bacterium JP3_11]|nr:MAG: hypothetical protein CFK48_05575 [Armatimonadetes bacterium CP1_7O]OYT72744.1 MAG: hypothetical protein CFK49_10785 [Armatimonadetes bacterium JP3_11]
MCRILRDGEAPACPDFGLRAVGEVAARRQGAHNVEGVSYAISREFRTNCPPFTLQDLTFSIGMCYNISYPEGGVMTIGRIVRELMLEHELSYDGLARIAGLSPVTVRGIATGRIRKPRAKTIAKIARAFGRDPKEFQHLLEANHG